jgi:hypothetical protein
MSSQTPIKPSPTKTPALPADLLAGLKSIGSSKSKSDIGWGATAQSTMPTDGLNIPGHSTGSLTGEQLYEAVKSAFQTGSAAGGNIRARLSQFIPGFTSKVAGSKWSTWDDRAIRDWLESVHTNNAINPNSQWTPASALQIRQKSAGGSGTAYNVTNNIRYTLPPAVVRAPATADLDAIAQKAFRDTLGRPPTTDESAQFGKQFQDLALSIGNSKNASKKLNTFAPVADPASLSGTGQTSAPVTGKIAKTADTLQSLPDAGVAATNFARNTAPAEAGAENIDNALNGMFASLARNSN